MTMQEWNKDRWIFKDIHRLGYPYYFIHPHKQVAVKYLVENLPDNTQYVLIFGSSVGTWHFSSGDLDICIIRDNKCSTSERNSMCLRNIDYNILEFNSLQEILSAKNELNDVKGEIFRKGVIVYESKT